MVVSKSAPAFAAATINVPFAAVAGHEIKVPALPEEPAIKSPAVA